MAMDGRRGETELLRQLGNGAGLPIERVENLFLGPVVEFAVLGNRCPWGIIHGHCRRTRACEAEQQAIGSLLRKLIDHGGRPSSEHKRRFRWDRAGRISIAAKIMPPSRSAIAFVSFTLTSSRSLPLT